MTRAAQPVVVAVAALARREQARLLAHRAVDLLGAQCVGHGVPAVRCVADAELAHVVERHAAALEVLAGALAFRRCECIDVEALRDFVGLVDLLGDAARLGVTALFGDLDAAVAGEGAHGLGEGEVLVLHQETDGIAADLTAEAVERLAFGIDVEGGRLLVVEGAEAYVVPTGLLELYVAPDEVDDVDAAADLADRGFGDSSQPVDSAPPEFAWFLLPVSLLPTGPSGASS